MSYIAELVQRLRALMTESNPGVIAEAAMEAADALEAQAAEIRTLRNYGITTLTQLETATKRITELEDQASDAGNDCHRAEARLDTAIKRIAELEADSTAERWYRATQTPQEGE